MSASAKFARVAEGLYRFSRKGKAFGSYYAYFWRGGKQIKQKLEAVDLEQARRELSSLRGEKERLDPGLRKITLADLLDRYLTTVEHLVTHSSNTRKSFVKRIKADWPEGKDQLVRDVKPSTVKQFIAGQSKRVGKVTLNAYRRVLRDSFKLAVGDKVISVSPAADLKGQRPDTPIRATPTVSEFRSIVARIRSQKLSDTAEAAADFVEFIGLAGLGNAEAAALTWKDVDFKHNRITTFRHKTSTGFVIPLYPQLRPLLERLYAARQHDGQVFRLKSAKKSIASACKALMFPAYTHRSFRRLFITTAVERGIDFKTIAGWQGHRDGGALIAKVYSHLRNEHSDAQAAKMN
jgi:integrase